VEALTPATAEILRTARLRQRLLLREIAETCGISTTVISNTELGKYRPSRSTGERIADALSLDDLERFALLAECGDGRGPRGPRHSTEIVKLICRGAEALDPRRQNRHSPRCRRTWTGPSYAAQALRSRRNDGSFVCKNCHGYEVLFRNCAPALVQRARDKAAIETDPAKRKRLKAVRMPRSWPELDRVVRLTESQPPGSKGGGRKRVGPASQRRLAASWAQSGRRSAGRGTVVSLCEVCQTLVFTPQYEANKLGRLNRFHRSCLATARRGVPRDRRLPRPSRSGRPRDVVTITRDFDWSVRHLFGDVSVTALAKESSFSEIAIKKALARIGQELPPSSDVAARFRPIVDALRVSYTPAHT
jgi:transcriptional regulator with XRE-family HTH domain